MFVSLTHGGRENNNAEDVHLLAAAWNRLIGDLGGRGQLQVHRLTFGVAVVRDDVDEIWLAGPGGDFEDGDQVCFILRNRGREQVCMRRT